MVHTPSNESTINGIDSVNTFIVDHNIQIGSEKIYAHEVNIKSRGAKGDGKTNDWEIIQRTIDSLANHGGGMIYFPKGTYAIYGKSLVIWGENITLLGESAHNTKIVKKGKVGYFGDCIDIAGKIKGYQYYGEFGAGDYGVRKKYYGETHKAQNITISQLTISTQLSDTTQKQFIANNLGIINVKDVLIESCIVENAPQTNIAMINDAKQFTNLNVRFKNCVFKNSGQHNVRVISYNQGPYRGNEAYFENCRFLNVEGKDLSQKEIKGQKILLWYRGSPESGKSYVHINHCYFDSTGVIFINSNANGFSIKNSTVISSLNIQHSMGMEKHPKIIIENTVFQKKGYAAIFTRDRMELNRKKGFGERGFKKVEFGILYPGNLKVNITNSD